MTTERVIRRGPLLSPATVAKRARNDPHLIYDIDYTADYITCACGWEGPARDGLAFAAHRREMARAERLKERAGSGTVGLG